MKESWFLSGRGAFNELGLKCHYTFQFHWFFFQLLLTTLEEHVLVAPKTKVHVKMPTLCVAQPAVDDVIANVDTPLILPSGAKV